MESSNIVRLQTLLNKQKSVEKFMYPRQH